MKPTPTSLSYLCDVSDKFRNEAREIESAFLTSWECDHVTQYSVSYAPHVDGCVVSLWDAWNRLLRRIVMQCCASDTVGLGGQTYKPFAYRTEQDVLDFLDTKKNRLHISLIEREPKWYNVHALNSITTVLGLQNSTQIIAAIGASRVNLGPTGTISNPLEDIRLVRNFIAHKAPSTLLSVQRIMGSLPTDTVHSYLWAKVLGGAERFSTWVTAMCALADAACT